MSKTYVVILAGGKGERLWPLSREQNPKQLLDLAGSSLLLKTIERSKNIVPDQKMWIITTKQQQKKVEEHVLGSVDAIIAEPSSRNTAPAILLTCLLVAQEDSDATVVFLPADHYIEQKKECDEILKKAIIVASSSDNFVLVGIKPTYAATGYGYICYDNNKKQGASFRVESFYEKPSKDMAESYLQQSNMLWNSGMIVGNVNTFLKAFEKHVPEMYHALKNQEVNTNKYEQLPSISFDYAVLERSSNCVVIPATFGWSDVGNLETFLKLKALFEKKEFISYQATNNLVSCSDSKIVALVGVDNLCVVQTDDVLLIVHREHTEMVKNLVALLKQKGENRYL